MRDGDRRFRETACSDVQVMVERRTALGLLLGALAGSMARAEADARLTLEGFLAEANPLARRLVGDATAMGQDAYLHALAALAVRLANVPVPEMRDSGQGAGPGTFIGFNPGGDAFTLLHWKMAPGSRVRRHAHTYGNVVTVVLEGQAEVENFEMEGARDLSAPGTFRVRRTALEWLRPGGINLVSLERNYVHGSRAGRDGARGLDITTRLHEKRPTPYLEIGDKPVADGDVFEGRWTD